MAIGYRKFKSETPRSSGYINIEQIPQISTTRAKFPTSREKQIQRLQPTIIIHPTQALSTFSPVPLDRLNQSTVFQISLIILTRAGVQN